MTSQKENQGCGCANIPISLIIVLLAVGYGGFRYLNHLNIDVRQFLPDNISKLLPNNQQTTPPNVTPTPSQEVSSAVNSNSPLPQITPTEIPTPITETTPTPKPSQDLSIVNSPLPQDSPSPVVTPKKSPLLSSSPQTPWEKKQIRGIYLSRYQITNNADEQTIRERVRYYRKQGINTIIHGVWGNGCTMYKSEVMQQTLGYESCPNEFQDQWLNWLIDEAHKQGMQVHAYFEKGIKIDEKSPIFDLAVSKRWIVPGVDKTYAGIDHYVLDMDIPEVATFFQKIVVEFVKKYPNIDAVQWDDYLGYYAELPGKVDRTTSLTKFVQKMRSDLKKANPKVSFDLCHHNPYWGKRYFAADWENWHLDRVFIQNYNDANFAEELNYAEKYAGVAITEKQLYRLKELINNPKIKSILIFPIGGKPEETAAMVKKITSTK